MKSDKRQVTVIKLELFLDGQVILGDFNQLCVPKIRKACLLDGAKYAPEVLVEGIEYREMGIIPKE